MSLCRHLLLLRRVFAMALGIAATTLALAEPIRFSTPAVPLAAPPRSQGTLPEPRTRGMDFSGPDMEAPISPMPQPQSVMRRPRDEKRDDRPRLFSDPKMFSDLDSESRDAKDSANSLTPSRALSPWFNDKSSLQRSESARSLAPVTDFSWDARNSAKQKDIFGNKTATSERSDERARSPFAPRDDSNSRLENERSNPLFEMFGVRVKEKPTAGQLERRAAFETLLNPNSAVAGKGPSSLEPVVGVPVFGVDSLKQPAPLAIPTIGGSKLDPRIADPMTVFNQQQEQRLRGPAFEEFDKKYATQPSHPAAASFEQRYQTPLNRQPTVHEFPTRKF